LFVQIYLNLLKVGWSGRDHYLILNILNIKVAVPAQKDGHNSWIIN
jgi:hypothetical protein